jgi:hypothetical protein
MAHYLSPHSLGKQDELADALKILCKQVRINTTIYQSGKTNYSIYNVSVQCLYNDGKQTADVLRNNTITITGGKVEFAVTFNFSISKLGSQIKGWAYGTYCILFSIGDIGYRDIW